MGRQGTTTHLKTDAERKSRLILARKVTGMRPMAHAVAERQLGEGVKALSVTRDNGQENRAYQAVGIPS